MIAPQARLRDADRWEEQRLRASGMVTFNAADDEYNNTEAAPIDMEEYRAKAIREGGFGSIDSDDDFEDDGGTIDAHDA